MRVLIILFVFLKTVGYSQNSDCCDSLLKYVKGKPIKTICRKPINGRTSDITISIDNSHSANNNLAGRFDTLSNQRTIIKDGPKIDDFKWSDYFKPSIDLIIAIIGAFTLIWKYLNQKQKEFTERIIENKRIAYSDFLKNFTETAVKVMYDKNVDGIKHDTERMFARNQLLLYANDKVIKAYHVWVDYADKENSNIDREVELFGKILIEIRKDIHGDSKVTEEEISNLNPFNRG